jgi:hypothetical protein
MRLVAEFRIFRLTILLPPISVGSVLNLIRRSSDNGKMFAEN